MARMPDAVWRPISCNYVSGSAKPVVGMVVHHMVGPEESAFARFNQQGSYASAHFGVHYDGTIVQYVDTADVAYHACMANWTGFVGVENESPSQDDVATPDNELWAPLHPEQVAANGKIARWLHDTHGMALRVADANDLTGVGYHSLHPGACSVAWGQTGCPGEAVANQRGEIVSAALGVTATVTSTEDEEDMALIALDVASRKSDKPRAWLVEGGVVLHEYDGAIEPDLFGGNIYSQAKASGLKTFPATPGDVAALAARSLAATK